MGGRKQVPSSSANQQATNQGAVQASQPASQPLTLKVSTGTADTWSSHKVTGCTTVTESEALWQEEEEGEEKEEEEEGERSSS